MNGVTDERDETDMKLRRCSETIDSLCRRKEVTGRKGSIDGDDDDDADDDDDEACEESWSDEEGEDPSYTYDYPIRRRR